MGVSENQKVIDFLKDIQLISPEQYEMIQLIKKLFTDEYPDLHEDVKYGGLVFIKSGLLTAGIFPYKNHISIEFSNGADFDDPSKLLEGKGAKRRHLKIIDKNHLNENIIAFFIKQAANE